MLGIGRSAEVEVRFIEENMPLGAEVSYLGDMPLPPESYDSQRDQYEGNKVLSALKEEFDGLGGVECGKVLGITPEDMFVPELNFIFGLAQVSGRYAVISTSRLESKGRETYMARVLKEAVHEIGHTLGLRHCPDPECVMHFSNSLRDTDLKGHQMCGKCLSKLGEQ